MNNKESNDKLESARENFELIMKIVDRFTTPIVIGDSADLRPWYRNIEPSPSLEKTAIKESPSIE